LLSCVVACIAQEDVPFHHIKVFRLKNQFKVIP
jgi:hypothetical protein